jgi:hypothetical protein
MDKLMINRNAPITITLTMTYDEWCEINEALEGYGYDYGYVPSMVTLGAAIDNAQEESEGN